MTITPQTDDLSTALDKAQDMRKDGSHSDQDMADAYAAVARAAYIESNDRLHKYALTVAGNYRRKALANDA